MKKIFTVLLSLFIVSITLWAQDVDRSFVFVDENGAEVVDGATIVRNLVQNFDEGTEFINAGLSIQKTSAAASSDYIKLSYTIEQIDNGSYQLCYPTTCNMQTGVGTYETGIGQPMGDIQDIQCEWFPTACGTCVVTMTIEIFTKQSGFPPTYAHKAYGPSVTVQFVKASGVNDDSPYVKLADGVYMDGTTLYITSGVTSLGNLQVDPSEIYCYAVIPPACMANTFNCYDATLHVPAAGMVSYFTALYWYNFNNILSDAIEPLSVTMNTTEAEVEIGQQLSLSATVAPGNATPKTVYWSSTDASVATVSAGGTVTAVTAGECDIIATCVDKVAACHVKVVSPRVTITLDKHEASLLPNHTITLSATCSPVDVELAVTSSNPGVAIPRLVNGTIMVVGVAEGKATITVNAVDGWGNPDSCEVTVYIEPGDVNSDGYVNISDVTALIDYLLSGNPSGVNLTGADCNSDNNVNISDVTTLIDFLLSGEWPWEEPQDEHEYVDLGLPSGTLWATSNVGASSPEESGYFFAWGETAPKAAYTWENYKWCNGSKYTMTKYCIHSNHGYNGFVDGKTELDPEDDAAYVNWGSLWRMPTKDQLDELREKCTWTGTKRNGVDGMLVTGPNGNSMFMPVPGFYKEIGLCNVGEGYCWSRSLGTTYSYRCYALYFYPEHFYPGGVHLYGSYDRYNGFSVRAVRVP